MEGVEGEEGEEGEERVGRGLHRQGTVPRDSYRDYRPLHRLP